MSTFSTVTDFTKTNDVLACPSLRRKHGPGSFANLRLANMRTRNRSERLRASSKNISPTATSNRPSGKRATENFSRARSANSELPATVQIASKWLERCSRSKTLFAGRVHPKYACLKSKLMNFPHQTNSRFGYS